MIDQQNLSRRVLLKGLGFSFALPWLESTHLGANETAVSPTKKPKRFACMFIGDGISPPHWWSKGDGADMELGSSLKSLEPFKDKLNVINGLYNRHGNGGHAKCTGNILSGANLKRGREILGGVSMDQTLAKHFEDETFVPSLVLGSSNPSAASMKASTRWSTRRTFHGAIRVPPFQSNSIRRWRSTLCSEVRPALCRQASSTTCSNRPTT